MNTKIDKTCTMPGVFVEKPKGERPMCASCYKQDDSVLWISIGSKEVNHSLKFSLCSDCRTLTSERIINASKGKET